MTKHIKSLLALFLVIAMIICCIPYSVVALDTDYVNAFATNSTVYASKDQQEQIYELLLKESFDFRKALDVYSLSIVKETITPVYTIDLIEYAATGQYRVRPMWCSRIGAIDNGSGNVFIAKTITAEKQYGGNLMFSVENGVAYHIDYSPSEYSGMWLGNGCNYPASASYADHKTRIASITKDNKLQLQDVKFVHIDQLGDFFYIDNDKHQILVALGYIQTDSEHKCSLPVDYTVDPRGELLDLATDYAISIEEYKKAKADWEVKHPGEFYTATGEGTFSPIISESSQVANIIDFELSQDHFETTHISDNDNKYDIFIVVLSIVAFAVVVYILFWAKRKKHHREYF